ncbi:MULTISPECIES: DsrH/TusB family sulfur relay protein [Avibacterium]|uniref:tRNA 2-thiouridine synthesizing protein B n=1 Tax=Avibacterium avium TaxID=751 RepID=A0A379APV4_AVIAV|nr:DsrH/TusB family sulfur metabolism protein [Avibacterium avium]SUB23442.1 tRNA 2-thiouridine synthesizing protein B [Avibacterium avium]
MLYTFAKADYDSQTLQRYFAHFHSQDCVVLWQDGVLLPLKYPELFAQLSVPCYALENDIYARNLQEIAPHFVNSYENNESKVRLISLQDFVALTERYFPQIAL